MLTNPLTRRRFMTLSASAGALTLFSPRASAADNDLQQFERQGRAMGAEVSLRVLHHDAPAARKALDAAMSEIDRIEDLMSIYRPQSQLSRLNRAGVLDAPDASLLEILNISREYSRKTDGAFDVTVQPLWELYARTIWKEKRIPSADEIESARARVNYRDVEITAKRIRFTKPNMSITLNGIAQGYATDRALSVIREHGIAHALVNAGEIGALGGKSTSEPWQAGIQDPRKETEFLETVSLRDRCLATSGDYATTFTPDRKYNHIFDPHTGLSPQEFSSVSVLCPKAVDADALCKGIFVQGIESSRKLIEQTAECEAICVRKSGEVVSLPLAS